MTSIEALPLSTLLAFGGIAIMAAMVHGTLGIGFPLVQFFRQA